MQKISPALTAAFLLSALCTACGGGGSDGSTSATGTTSTVTPAATPAPAAAPSPAPAPAPAPATATVDYSGTYNCAATSGSDEVLTAVLPTPSGDFSSCSGSVDRGANILSCSGSISETGAFLVISQDASGNIGTRTGTVEGSTVTGTFSVPAVNINNATFGCTRS